MSNAKADRTAAALIEKLRDDIARHGPMPVDRYMRMCLADPEHGYWQQAATIGADGDFITSPEISQAFGELIGLWSAVVWESMGRPAPLRLVELGPGRGTLMRDALRAAKAVPQFLDAASVHLIEVSAPLRVVQRQVLLPPPLRGSAEGLGCDDSNGVSWHDDVSQVPPGAAIVIANEFLDALPVRQLVYGEGAWRERVVDLAREGGLRFAVGHEVHHYVDTPPEHGAIIELRAGEEDVLAALAARAEPSISLFIDYGPAELSLGDTLQAVRRHAYADPLAEPGLADLTAHVQFAALARKARAAGFEDDGPITQAEFLGRLGIIERAARLMSANPARAGEIEASVQRLISPTGMGGLFKVLAVRSPTLSRPVPFG